MLFNSIDFAIFLPVVLILYWFVFNRNLRIQNLLIVIASYFFYGWWDWRFLSLILFSTIIDFSVGMGLKNQENKIKRKLLLFCSIFVNIGLLGFFKYYNFFIDNFVTAFSLFGKEIKANSLNIILPVGISFYTFQTLSYTIDVYRRKLEPTRDYIAFTAFVSFFPQLVAGPIERATNLLPQFYQKRTFDKSSAIEGVYLVIWGLLKKIVIADNCAIYVNEIFANYPQYGGSTLLLGAVLFAFQIYGDFSGYSDIAIGTAKFFGFSLMRNFNYPYFSRDIAEFWRRWHISLSTWFRDYLYIPLGGSRGPAWERVRNTMIIFVVSGFWHGANWTFIIWGALNAIYFLPLLLTKTNRRNIDTIAENRLFPNLKEILQLGTTFILTTIAWIFFRSENLGSAIDYLKGILSTSIISKPEVASFDFMIMLICFIMVEWFSRNKAHPFQFETTKVPVLVFKRVFLSVVIWSIILWGAYDNKEFIYFQF